MAARSTFTRSAGNTITAALNNSIRDHLVTTTTSNDVASEGQMCANTSTNRLVIHDGSAAVEIANYGAWESWAPVVTQSGVATVSVNRARYWRSGRTIIADCYVTVTVGVGGGSTLLTVSLPVTAAATGAAVGDCWMLDSSTGFGWFGVPYINTTSTVAFLRRLDGAAHSFVGTSGWTSALAANDVISVLMVYEAAS
jgi:hypothetical protein